MNDDKIRFGQLRQWNDVDHPCWKRGYITGIYQHALAGRRSMMLERTTVHFDGRDIHYRHMIVIDSGDSLPKQGERTNYSEDLVRRCSTAIPVDSDNDEVQRKMLRTEIRTLLTGESATTAGINDRLDLLSDILRTLRERNIHEWVSCAPPNRILLDSLPASSGTLYNPLPVDEDLFPSSPTELRTSLNRFTLGTFRCLRHWARGRINTQALLQHLDFSIQESLDVLDASEGSPGCRVAIVSWVRSAVDTCPIGLSRWTVRRWAWNRVKFRAGGWLHGVCSRVTG